MKSKTLTPEVDTQLALASGVAGFKISKSDRDSILSCFAGLDNLSDPLKEKFAQVKAEVETALASIPVDTEIPTNAPDHAATIASLTKVLAGHQQIAMACKADAEKSNQDKITALASIPVEAKKHLETLLASGDVVKKEDVATKIADAVTAAKTAVLAEVKVIGERRTQLASIKIAPADELLGGKDEEFKAKVETAKVRIAKLDGFGLPEDRITALAWASSDSQFEDSVALMNAARASVNAQPAARQPQPNPFIAAPPASLKDIKTLGAL